MSSSPIRVGFIGLSTNPTSWARTAHLPYLTASPHYKIVALQNSSIESAKAAIEHYKLAASTRAYDNPEALANDPEIDLVVCSVNVERHYELIKPAIQAGKDVVVEWPLGSNLAQAEELTKLAANKKVRNGVVLQGRFSPAVLKIRELLQSGRIGKVMNTSIVGYCGVIDNAGMMPEGMKYLLDRKTGGNLLTIPFMHMMDSFLLALGELESFNSILSIQRPKVKVTRDGEVIDEFERTTHDQILLHGKLSSGAVLSCNIANENYVDTAIRWNIQGTEGHIEYTSSSAFPSMSPDISITIFDTTGKSEVVPLDNYHKDTETELLSADAAAPAENVARFYEAFRKGETERYSTFEHAVKRHRLIDAMYKGESSYA